MQATEHAIDVSKDVRGFPRTGADTAANRGRKLELVRTSRADAAVSFEGGELLHAGERTLLSAIQDRTSANLLSLLVRSTGAKLGWRTDEERRQQQLLRQIERLAAVALPAGYGFVPQADDVGEFVLGKSAWAVLALACHMAPFARRYCNARLGLARKLPAPFFGFWQHRRKATREFEWSREDAILTSGERDKAVDELIELLQGVDALLLFQAPSDVDHFAAARRRSFTNRAVERLNESVLSAYRAQFIASGMNDPQFTGALEVLTTSEQRARLRLELVPMMA